MTAARRHRERRPATAAAEDRQARRRAEAALAARAAPVALWRSLPDLRRAGGAVGRARARTWCWRPAAARRDWLLGPFEPLGRRLRGRRARPGRSSTPGCGSRCSRTARCCRARGALGPRAVVAAIVAAHVAVPARAAAALAGRVQLHLLRAARRGARPRPLHAQPRATCPATPVYPYAGSKDFTSVYGPLFTVATFPLAKTRRAGRVLGAEGGRRAREPRRSSRSCGGARGAWGATRACPRWWSGSTRWCSCTWSAARTTTRSRCCCGWAASRRCCGAPRGARRRGSPPRRAR